MLAAKRYICAVGSGVTKPAFFEASDGNIYVVKLARRHLDYPWLISEQLAASIGHHLNLPFPQASPIYVDNDTFGTNLPTPVHFASRYLEGSSYLNWQCLPKITNIKDISGLILFDCFFFNDDRIKRNRNLLLLSNGNCSKIVGIDHSHLFGTLHWGEQNLLALPTIVPDYDLTLWQTLLSGYNASDDLWYYSHRLQGIIACQRENIIRSIPEEWFDGNKKIRLLLADFLTQRGAILPLLTGYIIDKLKN